MNDKISGYSLDQEQRAIVLDNSKYLLVVAGAGSGKTLTILGKINYLVKYRQVDPNQILCISFTKKAADSLKTKIESEFGFTMPVYTFHKLSIELLKEGNNSYEIADSNLLENMIHQFFQETILQSQQMMIIFLRYFKVQIRGNIQNQYLKFYHGKYSQVLLLEKLFATFIHLLKCNNYSLEDFSKFLKQARKTIKYFQYRKEKYFLILSLNIYLLYRDYLEENQEIDFNDMILKATKQVKKNGTAKKYRYIIIDEYQDTSYIRFCLVKEILEKTGAKLMVVGDDFQSIYRFTGCDLALFLNFKDYFKEAKVMKIQNTYRNSQELIKIAGDFVMKNKKQIYKKLRSSKSLDYPVQLIYYDDIKSKFQELVTTIYENTKKPIMILGRNNKDIELVLGRKFVQKEDGQIVYQENPNIFLYYLTVHKSKGLEEENVILINLTNQILGFPSQMKEERVLRFVSKIAEKYPYSEERRLFYVALTRTKNYVYLLVPKKNSSIFVTELVHDYPQMVNISNGKKRCFL